MRNWKDITEVRPVEGSNLFWFMTFKEFQNGIIQLQEEGLILPYNLPPASHPEGVASAVCTSWARWRTYEWNPPEFMSVNEIMLQAYGDTDLNASPKPNWVKIKEASNKIILLQLREVLLINLKAECRKRVSLNYTERESSDINEEIFIRLRKEQTPAQDLERDRLRGVYTTLKVRINGFTAEELEAFDITDDAIWVST